MAQFEVTFNNFLWLGLFVVAFFSFAIIIQEDNNAPQKFGDDPLVNMSFQNLRQNITTYQNDSEIQYSLFNDEKPRQTLTSIVLFTIISSGKTFGSIIIQTFFILIKFPLLLFGIDPTIISILVTWLSILLIIGLWALYVRGS